MEQSALISLDESEVFETTQLLLLSDQKARPNTHEPALLLGEL